MTVDPLPYINLQTLILLFDHVSRVHFGPGIIVVDNEIADVLIRAPHFASITFKFEIQILQEMINANDAVKSVHSKKDYHTAMVRNGFLLCKQNASINSIYYM